MQLTDKTAVVTGAASGIGHCIAQTFAAEGARVIIADVNEEGGRAAAEALANTEFIPLDLLDDGSIAACAAAALDIAGQVDILVNAAGLSKNELFINNDQALWDRIVRVNYRGPVALTQALAPQMIERSAGKIVNISSDAGRVGSLGETVYAGAKGAVIAFTKSLARELARYKINVNCVAPGPTDTPMMAAVPEKVAEALVKAIPFRRLGQPQDIANAVLFFAGDMSDYVTGQVLSVSGGLTMAD